MVETSLRQRFEFGTQKRRRIKLGYTDSKVRGLSDLVHAAAAALSSRLADAKQERQK